MDNILKVGDIVVITDTEDYALSEWLEEQEEKGIKEHKVIDIDRENGTFWIENCPYAVWFIDEYWIFRNKN